MMKNLSLWILIGMMLGAVTGALLHPLLSESTAQSVVSQYLSIFTEIFLRAIKMIIAPLVFCGLVSGIANMQDPQAIGRMGVRSLAWFLSASVVSLLIGIVACNVLNLGGEMAAHLPAANESSGINVAPFNLKSFIINIVPQSVVSAMASNDILQIVLFAVLFGFATASVGGALKRRIVELTDAIFDIMLKLTGYIMWLAPLGVGAALCSIITTRGLGVLGTYGKLLGGYYLALILLALFLIGVGRLILGPRIYRLLALIRDPLLIGFSTSSSEATFPKTIEQLQRFGVPRRVSGFVLPLGYSFNLDGAMLYQSFAVIFIAQAFHIEMTFAQQVGVLLVMLLTSKGMAGVPRASLVVVAASLPSLGLPASGLLLLLGIDPFFDMGRTAINVLGNSIATASVSKWEGYTDAEIPHAVETVTQPSNAYSEPCSNA
ncbi:MULTISPECIES: dicarboxylate/amino acid:cation symporter [unclassified Pseudomonas]|uniref:dicarboxylate/amino acid:cation symporter n=1 Tax=unclassified Pseudomonas TaxID=196821 RepID=UPI0015A2DCA1|nr:MULTISPECIES: dicarboxylate/amino acid:cation symporter [unclassified Pseudomonas]NWC96798.1 dicarboxylate/amino acid:cation symporter [Pseudomonas sp. IPO3779]NWD21219.1 dicarboxylate/amino acid:cation symporter [Pseudomonas sp. IPO3778]